MDSWSVCVCVKYVDVCQILHVGTLHMDTVRLVIEHRCFTFGLASRDTACALGGEHQVSADI